MKKRLSIMTILAGILLLASLSSCSREKPPIFKTAQGQIINMASYHGKWVFINYWATWCHNCKDEIAALNKFNAAHKNKDAVVLGVNYDQLPKAKLLLAEKQFNIQFPVIMGNPAAALKLPATAVLPVTYVINPKGKMAGTLVGPQTVISLEKTIKKLQG